MGRVGSSMNRRSFLKVLSVIPFVGSLAVAKSKVVDDGGLKEAFVYGGHLFRVYKGVYGRDYDGCYGPVEEANYKILEVRQGFKYPRYGYYERRNIIDNESFKNAVLLHATCEYMIEEIEEYARIDEIERKDVYGRGKALA